MEIVKLSEETCMPSYSNLSLLEKFLKEEGRSALKEKGYWFPRDSYEAFIESRNLKENDIYVHNN